MFGCVKSAKISFSLDCFLADSEENNDLVRYMVPCYLPAAGRQSLAGKIAFWELHFRLIA
jgi:hypothetical protein